MADYYKFIILIRLLRVWGTYVYLRLANVRIYIEKRAAERIIETTVTVRALPHSDWETFRKETAAKNYKRLKLISLLDQKKKDLLCQTRRLLTIEQSDKQHDCMSLPNYFRFCTKENGTFFFHTQLFITGREINN